MAQKLVRRHATTTGPGRNAVEREITKPQPGMRRAPAHRRLVDRRGETERRHRGQRADITRPGDAEKFAPSSAHPRHLGVAPETLKRPIERPHQPRRPALFARQRRAGPLIGGIEQPHAGKAERVGDLSDLFQIRRTGAGQPAPRRPIEKRQRRQHRTWKKRQARIAQRTRLGGSLARMAQRPAVADINDRNRWQPGVHAATSSGVDFRREADTTAQQLRRI